MSRRTALVGSGGLETRDPVGPQPALPVDVPRLPSGISRRDCLRSSAAVAASLMLPEAGPSVAATTAAARDPIKSLIVETIFRGSLSPNDKPLGKTWFSTRCCLIPGRPVPTALMLMAEITGNDYFGPVMQTESTDWGTTWSEPAPVSTVEDVPLAELSLTE